VGIQKSVQLPILNVSISSAATIKLTKVTLLICCWSNGSWFCKRRLHFLFNVYYEIVNIIESIDGQYCGEDQGFLLLDFLHVEIICSGRLSFLVRSQISSMALASVSSLALEVCNFYFTGAICSTKYRQKSGYHTSPEPWPACS
jgi:hypothetical protein